MTTMYQPHNWNHKAILLSGLLIILFLMGDASAAFRHGVPSNGDWRFKLDLDPFATGPRWRYCEFNCGNPDLRNGDFNDQASSFSICNRTGGPIGVRVRFWQHINYNNLVYNVVVELDDEQCHIENLPPQIDNDISSYTAERVY